MAGYGSRQLFHNNGDGTFTDVTAKAGVAGGGWVSSAAWVDYDRDGYLDLFVVRYLDYDIKTAPYCGYKQEGYRMYCDPQQFDGVPDQLFRNNRDGTFTDVSRKAGIANRPARDWASSSATSTWTAGPTSSSPTTACAISSTATKATGRSPT